MTLTLELTPELEARLRDKARARGVALDDYVLDLAERDLQPASLPVPTVPTSDATSEDAQVEALWAAMTGGDDVRRDATIKALLQAPEGVRARVTQRSIEAAQAWYATPEGQAEWDDWADWRALDSEDFLGFEDEDASELAAVKESESP